MCMHSKFPFVYFCICAHLQIFKYIYIYMHSLFSGVAKYCLPLFMWKVVGSKLEVLNDNIMFFLIYGYKEYYGMSSIDQTKKNTPHL